MNLSGRGSNPTLFQHQECKLQSRKEISVGKSSLKMFFLCKEVKSLMKLHFLRRLKDSRVSGTPGSAGSAKSTTPTRTTTATKGLVAYQDPDAGMSDEDRESGIILYFFYLLSSKFSSKYNKVTECMSV